MAVTVRPIYYYSSSSSAPSSPAEPVPGEEQAVRAWLVEQGFEAGDLRSEKQLTFYIMTPMVAGVFKGELNVCQWLCNNGAAEDISKADSRGRIPMHWACDQGELSTCKWLFEVGAADNIIKVDGFGFTPVRRAFKKGHLPVCKWLLEVAAEDDISTPDGNGNTLLFYACESGELSLCKWLFEVRADEDIAVANNKGTTLMHVACSKGYRAVCEWLLEVGGAELITKVDIDGVTLMHVACEKGHLSVCEWLLEVGAGELITKETNEGQTPMLYAHDMCKAWICHWLVLNGALNQTATTAAAESDGDSSRVEVGHVDPAFVARDTRETPAFKLMSLHVRFFSFGQQRVPPDRPELLKWAKGLLAIHHTFLHVVLRGSVILPASQKGRRISPRRRCYLQRLPRDEMERVGSFLGVESGRKIRNVREFAEALKTVLANEEEEAQQQPEEDICTIS